MRSIHFNLPQHIVINNRIFFQRSKIEHTKNCLMAESMGREMPPYAPPPVEELVTAARVSFELGISRRTLARRIAKQEKSRAA